jgi:hypothetical protein|nr:hypothetical protein [Kofleriaceae bacterium]
MRVLLWVGFVFGAVLGAVLGVVAIFWVSLIRGKRAVHADGVLCRAEVTGGSPLDGPALVRLSGAFAPENTTGHDVLGLALRCQKRAVDDAADGDQDLLLGSFESFRTAEHDKGTTDAGDYLNNLYSSVTPWLYPQRGPITFHIGPLAPAPPRDRGADRDARLDADLAADRARLALRAGTPTTPGDVLAEIRLIAKLPIDQRALHESMFRTGRGVRPRGIRNGIRATVYPISQLARSLRGG